MNLPAGRELDALVHAAIGVPWDESRCPICGWPLAETMAQGCVKGNCSQRPSILPRSDPPHYSTTWEGMRLVLERMRELGWLNVELRWVKRGKYSPLTLTEGWSVFFNADFAPFTVGYVEAVSAPLAVCLAALKAVQKTAGARGL